MARNKVQYQKGLSEDEFERQYGSEEQCRAAVVKWRWPDGFVCPECGHEWSPAGEEEAEQARVVHDTNGNVLANGDTVEIMECRRLSSTKRWRLVRIVKESPARQQAAKPARSAPKA